MKRGIKGKNCDFLPLLMPKEKNYANHWRQSSEGQLCRQDEGSVSVTLDNCFVVHDIKVIEGKERLFIAMPSRKTAEGEFKDIAHPINTALRDEMQTLILAKYEEALAEMPAETEE